MASAFARVYEHRAQPRFSLVVGLAQMVRGGSVAWCTSGMHALLRCAPMSELCALPNPYPNLIAG